MRETKARPALPQQNLIDKAIEYFAPRVAQRRLMARVNLAVIGG